MSNETPTTSSRRRGWTVVLCVAAAIGWATGVAAEEMAPHGAMKMDAQQQRLEQLSRGSGLEVPEMVDAQIWAASIPKDNQPTAARVALGKKLFFDLRLSADGTLACATCHDVSRSFADLQATSEGIRAQRGTRNSPTAMNAALLQTQFWDGREPTLEAQAQMPIINPVEMGQPHSQAAADAISGDAEYKKLFQDAYGRDVNVADIGRALAAFQRTLVFLDAPLDAYLGGDENAISSAAKQGWQLFNGKARCVSCHALSRSNPLGTDHRFHNIGVSARHQDFEGLAVKALRELDKDSSKETLERLALQTGMSELGRFMVTRRYADIGAFRTPQLRNVGITPPYMHDGSLATMWDVMDHYNKGGEPNSFLDGGMEALALSEEEVDQLVELMFAFTDRRFAAANTTELERQRALAATQRPVRDDAIAQRKTIDFETRIGK